MERSCGSCLLKLLAAFVIFVAKLLLSIDAVAIDNAVIGQPTVTCGAETVELQFKTKHPFKGKVFVKGHSNIPDCRADFGDVTPDSNRTVFGRIVISHGSCDMERQRMIDSQGIEFQAVIVISFHKVFITKVDKAYNLKCTYREISKFVTASSLNVSMLTTQNLEEANAAMPTCTYTIHRDTIDGEILQYAKVGEQVVHRWECDSDTFGILIHSCVLEDGQGEKFQVLDENGCEIDKYIMQEPTYVESLNMAYREAHVVKFADKVAVQFLCQLKLCMKEGDGCNGITPPNCPPRNGSAPAVAPSGGRKNATGPGGQGGPAGPPGGQGRTTPQPSVKTPYATGTGSRRAGQQASTLGKPSAAPPGAPGQKLPTQKSSRFGGQLLSSRGDAKPTSTTTTALPQLADADYPSNNIGNGGGEEVAEYVEDQGSVRRRDAQRHYREGREAIKPLKLPRAKLVPQRVELQTASSSDLPAGDLKSQTIYVIDTVENVDNKVGTNSSKNLEVFFQRAGANASVGGARQNVSSMPLSEKTVCLSVLGFGFLLSTVTTLFVISTLGCLFCCYRRAYLYKPYAPKSILKKPSK